MSKSNKKDNGIPLSDLEFPDLVDIVKSRSKQKKDILRGNEAYNELEKRMKNKIGYISSKFFIPGYTKDDIHQESLYALRFKAVPDYKKEVIGRNGPYPFDKFAVLCIRRHLSTLLKTCYQNKKKALSTSISLNQDRNDDSSESLFLIDILSDGGDLIIDSLGEKEYYKKIFSKLFSKLSGFEKKVFILYYQRYSYEEISDIINKKYKSEGLKKRINVKSIDNALSRLKQKGKDIFNKYGNEDE
jgi:DNA-directed RNA polymerase specialized sigma24 family protein